MKDQVEPTPEPLAVLRTIRRIQGTYAAQPDVIEERIHEALLALAKADPEVAAYFTQQGLQGVADQLGDERGV